jgi:hypothetical protein
MLLWLVPGGFLDLINWNNKNSSWKKLLGFGNKQAKLEKGVAFFFAKCQQNAMWQFVNMGLRFAP